MQKQIKTEEKRLVVACSLPLSILTETKSDFAFWGTSSRHSGRRLVASPLPWTLLFGKLQMLVIFVKTSFVSYVSFGWKNHLFHSLILDLKIGYRVSLITKKDTMKIRLQRWTSFALDINRRHLNTFLLWYFCHKSVWDDK